MWEVLKERGLVSEQALREEEDDNFRDQLYALAFFGVNRFGYNLEEAMEADFIDLYEAFHIYKRLTKEAEMEDD